MIKSSGAGYIVVDRKRKIAEKGHAEQYFSGVRASRPR
jgi:hypothetical protein